MKIDDRSQVDNRSRVDDRELVDDRAHARRAAIAVLPARNINEGNKFHNFRVYNIDYYNFLLFLKLHLSKFNPEDHTPFLL